VEKELSDRLIKVGQEQPQNAKPEIVLMYVTVSVLEAIRAHIIEKYPDRFGDFSMLEDAIEVVKYYQ
jgi:hypothetical protein